MYKNEVIVRVKLIHTISYHMCDQVWILRMYLCRQWRSSPMISWKMWEYSYLLSWYNYFLTCRTIKWQRRYLALKDFRKFVVEWHSVFCKSRTLTGQLWNLPTVMWKIWKRLIAKFLNWQGLLYVSFVTTSLITCLNRNSALPQLVQSSGKNGK